MREQNTIKLVKKEVVVSNLTLDKPTRGKVGLGEKGFETDRFGNPLGSNALDIVPLLEQPKTEASEIVYTVTRAGEQELRGVKSSLTLGRFDSRLRRKGSGSDMRNGKDEGNAKRNMKEVRRYSLYGEHGFF